MIEVGRRPGVLGLRCDVGKSPSRLEGTFLASLFRLLGIFGRMFQVALLCFAHV